MGADIYYEFQAKKDGKWQKIDTDFSIGRNYELFSWLAGVRGTLDPISNPKGLPEDLDYIPVQEHQIIDENTRWFGEHSQTWYDLDEIIEADSPAAPAWGYISMPDYVRWDGKSEPICWYDGVHGVDTVVADHDDDVTNTTTHILVSFETRESNQPEYIQIRKFISECVRLKELYPKCRIVMGFNS